MVSDIDLSLKVPLLERSDRISPEKLPVFS